MISKKRMIEIRRTSSRMFVSVLLVLGSSGTLYAADIMKGGKLYATHCVACHGASGVSVMSGALSFARSGGLLQPDFALLASIKSGKNVMPAFQGILSDSDILDVIVYLRTLN